MTRFAGVFAVLVLLAACSSKEAQVQKHFEKAKQLYSEGQFDKSGVELRNALQIDPNLAGAYYYAGLLEERKANAQMAFANFSKAAELDPGNLDARGKLARMYLLSGAFDKASEAARQILAARPGDAGAQLIEAAVAASKGDKAGALASAEALVAGNPKNAEAVALVAGLYREQGDTARAKAVLAAGLEASPSDDGLRGAMITLLAESGDLDGVVGQYRELVRQAPGNVQYRNGLAQQLARAGRIDDAEKVLREGVAAAPSEAGPLLSLAAFLAGNGRAADAERELSARLSASPGEHAVRLGLASLYRQQRKLDEALAEYDKVIQASGTDPAGLRARNAKAELLVARGRRDEAVALVNEVLKVNPRDNEALLLRGQASLARGDATSAVSDLRTVLKDQPNSIPVLTALARAHLANREPKLAVEIAGGAVDRYPGNAEVRLMAAEVRAGTGDSAGAIADLDAILKANPRDTRALLAKANLLIARKDSAAAERILRDAEAANPQDALIPYRLGMVLAAQNRNEQAKAQFETSLARMPGAIEPLNALARLYLSNGQASKAQALVEKAAAERPKDLLIQTLLGDVYSAMKRDADAEAAFRRAIEINAKVSGPYEELANHHLQRRDVAKATAAVMEGLQATPGNPILMHRRAMLHVAAGEFDPAMRAYEEILAARPDDSLAVNNLATLLLDHRSDAQSHQRALELARPLDSSPNPAHLDTLGWAHYRLGQYNEAIVLLRKANQKAPSVAIFNYHLGMALYKAGDTAGAKPYLEAAVKAGAVFPGLDEVKRILGQS